MNRMLGLTLVVGLSLGLSSSTHAQTFPADYFSQSHDGNGNGGAGLENLPFGGFGFEYTQGPPVSGVVMDQYGLVRGTSYFATSPVVSAEQPATVQPVARQTTRSRTKKIAVQPRYAVTTGSLGWTGANGMAGNSQAMRYRSYGYGYSVSPYGTTQYYGPWKGLTLGY